MNYNKLARMRYDESDNPSNGWRAPEPVTLVEVICLECGWQGEVPTDEMPECDDCGGSDLDVA